MIKYISNPTDFTATSAVMTADVGLCYFDEIDETLKEVSDDYFIGIGAYSKSIRKCYIIAKVPILNLELRLTNTNVTSTFDAKVIISDIEPVDNTFAALSLFNTSKVSNLIAYKLYKAWILIENKSPIYSTEQLGIEIEYE